MIDYQFWEFGPRSEHIPLPGYTGPLRQRKKYTKPMAMDLAKAGHYEAAELAENYMCPSPVICSPNQESKKISTYEDMLIIIMNTMII